MVRQVRVESGKKCHLVTGQSFILLQYFNCLLKPKFWFFMCINCNFVTICQVSPNGLTNDKRSSIIIHNLRGETAKILKQFV